MLEEKQFINTPMDERQLEALAYIKTKMGNGPDLKVANVDAIRRAVIEFAKLLGWQDPQAPAASDKKGKVVPC